MLFPKQPLLALTQKRYTKPSILDPLPSKLVSQAIEDLKFLLVFLCFLFRDSSVDIYKVESSLDIAMDEVDQGEVDDGHGVIPDEKDAQEPMTYTLEDVMDVKFDNPEVAIRFYEAYSR
ncbi:hypothetical protein PIB30_009698 [Stylosanthes scabra]|uniref:Uncharacterized protein n=1 Tax=Stylosanthes scabra TaxID=79078 RepID=A0ABU6V3H1_9FABA|nr:hypothetical protein [Stylosanthes scabra]